MKSPVDNLIPTLATWDLSDLHDLKAALIGLIEAMESPAQGVDDPTAVDHEISSGEGGRKPAKGHIETKYIPRGNKRHGPYLYLRYWQGGKLRSKYLGKPSS